MAVILWVAAGGAVGSVLRYLISDALDRRAAPWGTILVNLLGSLALGVLVGWFARRGADSVIRIAVGVGLLGGFTTFSSWAVETIALWDAGKITAAVTNVVVSLVAGLLAAGIGLAVGRSI
jgi:CrcB protein